MAVDVKQQAVSAELRADSRELRREFKDDAQDMRELTLSEQLKLAEQTRMSQEAYVLWQDTNANIDAAELAMAQQAEAQQQAAAQEAAEPSMIKPVADAVKDEFVLGAVGKALKEAAPSSLNVAAAKDLNPEALKDLAKIGEGAVIKGAEAAVDAVIDIASKIKM